LTLVGVNSLLSDLFLSWWAGQDESIRLRVLSLQSGDHLDGDLALSLQMSGFCVVAIGVVWSAGKQQWIGLYEQPDELVEFLAGGGTSAQ
jgi:hypothetical protein